MTDILLITEQSIKNITNISDNMAGKLLLTAIRESQEINLREILGDALLDELKRQVSENDVRETYNHLILQCQYYLAYQSCANICMITSVKIDNAGLQRVSDEKMEPLPVSEVNQIHDYYQQKADFYCERLQHYLLQHKEDYPQLSTRQCNSINANLYSSATCGIFLGGPRSKGTQRDCDGMNSSKSQGVEKLDVELIENGTYDYKPKGYGFNSAHIVVNTPEIKNQEKNINITENGTSTVIPDSEFTGMGSVDITVDVHPTERLVRTYTENGVYPIEGEFNGGEIHVETLGPESVIAYMNRKPYADETGLTALGWDEDDINYFKYNNYLYPWEFEKSKLTTEEIQTNLASCASSENWESNKKQVTFVPKDQPYTPTFFGDCHVLLDIPLIDTSSITNFNLMFYECKKLTTIPPINTSNGTIFGDSGGYRNTGMFAWCSMLNNIPLIDTSNGTEFGGMFKACISLSSIPPLNVSNGLSFRQMFNNCNVLTSIPELDTSNGRNFSNMFDGCSSLITIPTINTSNGTNFISMFDGCSSLITIPTINTSNGTNFRSMFDGCSSLTSVPLLDISNGTDINRMFYTCYKLTDITFTGSINATIDFGSCTKLSYNSIKSILTACAATTNTNSKTVSFNRTIADQNQELTNLVTQCTEKGWQVTGLTLSVKKLNAGILRRSDLNLVSFYCIVSFLYINVNDKYLTMTLSQIISIIKKIALDQPNIHSVVDEFISLNDITAKYSAVILQQQTHRRNNDFIQFNFYLGMADRLNEDKSNEIEIQSTGIQVINSIVYKLEDIGFDCSMGSYNVFTQRFLAEAAGAYTELSITVPVGECSDDFAEEKLDTTITSNGEYNFIPKGLGFQSVHLNVDVAHLQDKSLDITKNGNYKVQYDKGFSGLKSVDVNVNVPIPEINNQEKSITITENGQTDITPDTNYTGLSKVDVNVNIDTQSYYDNGYSQGKIDGKTEGIAEQKAKLTDIEIVENGVYERTDGYKKVEVNVPSPVIDLRETEITPETTEQIITPDGFDGYNRIIVKGVDSSIDSDIKPENIKSGVNILGVEGNLEGVNNQEKSITINSNGTSSVVPDAGYTGISKVDITVDVPTSGGDGIDLTSLGYTAQENTSINTDIQDNIAHSQSLLENYTDDTTYEYEYNMMFAPLFPCGNRKSFYKFFNMCGSLISIPSLNTSNGTNFGFMFYGCDSLTSVPSLDTSKGTNFGFMFDGCDSLTSVPSLNTSNGTDFGFMFHGCDSLTSIPSLDTSKGTDFKSMFYECDSLTSIPSLDTSNGTDFSSMFSDCDSLTSIPSLDTSKGTNFKNMFSYCSSLTSVPSLDTSKGTNFKNMFYSSTNLKTIESIDVSNGNDLTTMFGHPLDSMNLTNITFKGSINVDISFTACKKLSFNSIKSILTACSKTINTNSKTVSFNRTIQDQNNELTNLVASCTSKGWTVSGLTIITA